MAAGSGSRYGKLKQFDALGPKGEFLMEFSIYDAIACGFDHIVVITKAANKEFLESYLSQRLPKHIKLDVLVQKISDLPEGISLDSKREKPWGTAHAVWTARHVIGNDFAIINADDYYGKPAFESAANFVRENTNENTYALVGYNLKDTLSEHGTVSRGVCSANNGKLITIEELIKIHDCDGVIIDEDSGRILDRNTLVSMNFWICNKNIFDFIEGYFKNFLNNPENLEKNEIYIPFVAQEMMSNGLIDIEVLDSNSSWFGVTYADDKLKAVKTLSRLTAQGQYPSPIWN
ncbi:MAG: UTP--glucose-1-phosphate uridylyltransferase [Bacteroidia bacterium]|nr:UTP--glucose-1-phosphate uridylyltransferase [Bacteroidia bacterium]